MVENEGAHNSDSGEESSLTPREKRKLETQTEQILSGERVRSQLRSFLITILEKVKTTLPESERNFNVADLLRPVSQKVNSEAGIGQEWYSSYWLDLNSPATPPSWRIPDNTVIMGDIPGVAQIFSAIRNSWTNIEGEFNKLSLRHYTLDQTNTSLFLIETSMYPQEAKPISLDKPGTKKLINQMKQSLLVALDIPPRDFDIFSLTEKSYEITTQGETTYHLEFQLSPVPDQLKRGINLKLPPEAWNQLVYEDVSKINSNGQLFAAEYDITYYHAISELFIKVDLRPRALDQFAVASN